MDATDGGEPMAVRQGPLGILGAALAVALISGCASYETVGGALQPGNRTLIDVTAQDALERSKIGAGVNWSNPKSGRLGSIIPLRTFKSRSGADCRDYQQILTIDGRSYIAFDSACRQPDGTWKSLNYATPADSWAPYALRDYDYPYYRYGHHGYPYRYGYGHHHGYRGGFGVSIGVGRHFR